MSFLSSIKTLQTRSYSSISPETAKLKREARQLYKELIWLGKDYPLGEVWFKTKLHNCFLKKSGVVDPVELQRSLDHGNFIKREILALYSLKKYRHLKKVYYDEQEMEDWREKEKNWNQAT